MMKSFAKFVALAFLMCAIAINDGKFTGIHKKASRKAEPQARNNFAPGLDLSYETDYSKRIIEQNDDFALQQQALRLGILPFQVAATSGDLISMVETNYNQFNLSKSLLQLSASRDQYIAALQASDAAYAAALSAINPPTLHNYDQNLANIKTQQQLLDDFFKASSGTKQTARDNFLNGYSGSTGADTNINALSANFQAIVDEASTSSGYYRKYVADIGNQILAYISAGVANSFAYYYLTSGTGTGLQFLATWNADLIAKQAAIDTAQNNVKLQMNVQIVTDITAIATGVSNRNTLADSVADLCRNKYDWNSWMVVVTDILPDSGADQDSRLVDQFRVDVAPYRVFAFYSDKGQCDSYLDYLAEAVDLNLVNDAGILGRTSCDAAINSTITASIPGNILCTKNNVLGTAIVSVLDTGRTFDSVGNTFHVL